MTLMEWLKNHTQANEEGHGFEAYIRKTEDGTEYTVFVCACGSEFEMDAVDVNGRIVRLGTRATPRPLKTVPGWTPSIEDADYDGETFVWKSDTYMTAANVFRLFGENGIDLNEHPLTCNHPGDCCGCSFSRRASVEFENGTTTVKLHWMRNV